MLHYAAQVLLLFRIVWSFFWQRTFGLINALKEPMTWLIDGDYGRQLRRLLFPDPDVGPQLFANTGSSAGVSRSMGCTQMPDIHDSDFLAPPQDSNENSSVSDEDCSTFYHLPPSSISSQSKGAPSRLKDALDQVLCEWPKDRNRYFLPEDQFQLLITSVSIEDELDRIGLRPPSGLSKCETSSLILQHFPRIFAILALIDKTNYICDFIGENLVDKHLPFEKDGDFLRKSQPPIRVQFRKPWKPQDTRDFSRVQWSLLAPIFRTESHGIHHLKLSSNTIMPFILDASSEDPSTIKCGNFAEVYKVVFHPAHQTISLASKSSKNRNPPLAIKRLYSKDRVQFEQEVAMLGKFSGDMQHSHLAQLLMTFEFDHQFHLVFPFAECNLRTYWKKTCQPEFCQRTVEWFLRQNKGLASGVLRLHGYRNSFELQPATQCRGGNEENVPDSTNPEYVNCCRHGDIKPENILWTDEEARDRDDRYIEIGILILADFGEMRHYTTGTHLRNPPGRIAQTPAYAPPESDSSLASAQTSRAYDIWSLGCVYLESTIWLLCGWEDLCRFEKERDGAFHTGSTMSSVDKIFLKQCVRDWISSLHRNPKCSKFVHDFLDLISDMFTIEYRGRIRCDMLNKRLSEMIKRYEEDSDYLVASSPSHALCCCRREAPCPKEGSPLPTRPSYLENAKSLEDTRAGVSSKHLWDVVARANVSANKNNRNVAVERWTRAVATFHEQEDT